MPQAVLEPFLEVALDGSLVHHPWYRPGVALRVPAPTLTILLALACTSSGRSVDPEAYTRAIADRAAFRSELEASCPDLGDLDETIVAAIAIGAPIYNAGSALGCYRIYEGAAYKMLYRLEGRCPAASELLRAGLAKAETDLGDSSKAWTLRRAFDAILGEGTVQRGSY